MDVKNSPCFLKSKFMIHVYAYLLFLITCLGWYCSDLKELQRSGMSWLPFHISVILFVLYEAVYWLSKLINSII